MQEPLQQLLALPAIAETVIVSTCNRVEIYATSRDAEGAVAQIKHFYRHFTVSMQTNSSHTSTISLEVK